MNDTNYEIDLGHRVTCLHVNLLKLWIEITDQPAVNVVIVEEDGEQSEQFELPLISDVERDSGEFIIGERLTVQQRGQLLNVLEEHKDRFANRGKDRHCQS